jgi:hypothetical protein
MVIRVNHFENHFQAAFDITSAACRGPLDFTAEFMIIIVCCIVGLIWAFINITLVSKIDIERGITGYEDEQHPYQGKEVTPHQKSLIVELGHKISTVIIGSLRVPMSSSGPST